MKKPTAPTDENLRERREAFGEALSQAIAAAGVTQDELATRIGVKQPTVSGWITASGEPRYEDVFRTEAAIGVKPGALSRFLGYLPIEAVRTVVDLETIIDEDPRLTADGKDALRVTLRAVSGASGRGRPRKVR